MVLHGRIRKRRYIYSRRARISQMSRTRRVTIYLPLPPQGKERAGAARRTPLATRVYESILAEEAEWQWAASPTTGTVQLYIEIDCRSEPRPDLSNIIKSVEDAMNGVVYYDDRQIVELHARFQRDKSDFPGIAVRVVTNEIKNHA